MPFEQVRTLRLRPAEGVSDVAFRAGATTNIEVVDAQRRARDADTVVALSENEVRQARLALLNALGRFP